MDGMRSPKDGMKSPISHTCLSTMMTCHSLLYIKVLGVIKEAPPQLNIKLELYVGVKPHHKPTIPITKNPSSQVKIQGGFHQMKGIIWCPR